MSLQIHTAPPNAGTVVRGVTLPQMLDRAVSDYPNASAFNQPLPHGWRTMSNGEFKTAADELALGLLAIGLARGDRAAFFLNSDVYFTLADFGCLIAGIPSVPLYTTYARENLVYVTKHAEARAMFVSNPEMLAQLAEWIGETEVTTVILAEGEASDSPMPDGIRVITLDELREEGRQRGRANAEEVRHLRAAIDPQDLATLIYTSGTTGLPKGVMLSHENLSCNALTSLSTLSVLKNQEEVALTFLPLTHVFARMLQFAHVAAGHQIYYSDPDRLVEHLPEVSPTVFATVPRVLEKVFDKVQLGIQQATGAKKVIGSWALGLARAYETGTDPAGVYALKLAVADKLVYSKLREKLGLTRIKAVGVGGAALRPDLCDTFNAFGIPAIQGYGLTETSPVITINTNDRNRAGTVGQPIPGVEVAIAEDGEILTRGPHIMQGYFKSDDQTREVIDTEGWFHTGDIGEFTPEGYLKITDRKKALFKLSTGKYVIPQPIENRLMESALIEQAVVLGSGHKFSTALIFPNVEAIQQWGQDKGVDGAMAPRQLLQDKTVVREFERLVSEANQGMDHWNQIKRFRLIPELMDIDNGLLTPTMKVKRRSVTDRYAADIEAMYAADLVDQAHAAAVTN